MTAVGFEPTRIAPPELESGAFFLRFTDFATFHGRVHA